MLKSLCLKLRNQYVPLALLFALFSFISPSPHPVKIRVLTVKNIIENKSDDLYDRLKLNAVGLSKEALMYALEGYKTLASAGQIANNSVLSIVDFSLPSSRKRLFVIDMITGELLFNTFVAHGKNSGKESATFFSNEPNSFRSSLGFYVTGDTYKGQHGYSLRLEGKEEGINDNAFNRGIVMHAASYVSEKLARLRGYIGRSEGCPAVPVAMHKAIIRKIRNGSCLFLYGRDNFYSTHSKLLTQAIDG